TKWFGEWSTYAAPPEVELPAVPDNDPSSSVYNPPGQLQDVVSMTETVGLVRANAGYYALNLANQVLGGSSIASRLYHDLREQRGLVYFVDSELDVGDTRSTFAIEYACDPASVPKARALLAQDLREMQTVPVSDDELVRTKALLIRQLSLAGSGDDAIARDDLDRAVSGLPLDEPSQAAAAYASLTAADVMHAFAQWVRPSGFVEIIDGPYPPQ
ncbi:MAG TPA: insulinase family protein, partial [Candidatus Eremiobacteraceae bacterium]|nr:insulinase family protein [Candidatus Eremiobacteraceae bacterium]